MSKNRDGDNEKKEKKHDKRLIGEATVVSQAIKYPTDGDGLNQAREVTEQIMDRLGGIFRLKKRPRSYRQKAHRDSLKVVKKRNLTQKIRPQGMKTQRQDGKRNRQGRQNDVEQIAITTPGQITDEKKERPIPDKGGHQYGVIQYWYIPQKEMSEPGSKRCDSRIVNIQQPDVRPIKRGPSFPTVEFGAKRSVRLTQEGVACLDWFSWDVSGRKSIKKTSRKI